MFPDYAWTNEINKPFFLMQHNLSEEKILKEALSERFHQISEKIMNKVSNPLVYQIPRIQIQKNSRSSSFHQETLRRNLSRVQACKILLYADDIILVAKDVAEQRKQLNIMGRFAQASGLITNRLFLLQFIC